MHITDDIQFLGEHFEVNFRGHVRVNLGDHFKVNGGGQLRVNFPVTINQAKKLLQQRDKSIKEVARVLYFPEQFTFRKYFKEHTGMSPTEYKKRDV